MMMGWEAGPDDDSWRRGGDLMMMGWEDRPDEDGVGGGSDDDRVAERERATCVCHGGGVSVGTLCIMKSSSSTVLSNRP